MAKFNKRWLAGSLAGLALLVAAGGAVFWWMMQQPLYEIGSLSDRTDLEPVGAHDGGWQVAPGIELRFFASGSGRPVLFVHGGPGAPPDVTAPALDRLGDRFRVYYYDQRGSGNSTRPFSSFDEKDGMWANIQRLEATLGIGQQVADIERIRRLLDDNRLILVGHSYGALLAALYAAEFPDRVEKLVLLNPADLLVFPSPHDGLFGNIRGRLPQTRHDAYDAWLAEYLDFSNVFAKSESELQAIDAKFVNYFEEAMGPLPESVPQPALDHAGAWHARAQYFSMGQQHDWRDAMAAITAPALIVHGGRDFQPLAISKMYADSIPDARVAVVEDAGHFPHYTNPDALAPMLEKFLTD